MGGLWLLSGRAAPQSPLAPAPEPAELAADAQVATAARAAAAASEDAHQGWGGDGAVAGAEPGGGGDGGGLPYDLGFVHVKAVDEAGHDRNTALKLRCASSLQAPKR